MIGLFILIPLARLFKEVLSGLVDGVLFLSQQIGEFIFGLLGDITRFFGAVITILVVVPVALLNVILGNWTRASRFGHALSRECLLLGQCLWRGCIHRPLRLFMLDGLLEGLEKRVPKAVASSKKGTGGVVREQQFTGYTITGTLAGGGSGATLYVAEPDDQPRWKPQGDDHRVVIKCFALAAGSSLPQIVRESRALEAARRIGLVLEHQMDEDRFYYVMPYHAGDNLGVVIPQLHAQDNAQSGLNQKQLDQVIRYVGDLLSTLEQYHRNGLWHKDVKPENLIVQNGRAHLVDLGLVTPLRSAMTLTTHGTEYFRDPELVRQALRGVKVNEVDGTKFDIYAAGAVLYFALENTFPAHGGLSRFSKKSPEALKWIVCRAMAEYHKRYDSVAAMQQDLLLVLEAESIWDVRAADLPSMSHEEIVDEQINSKTASYPPTESPLAQGVQPARHIAVTKWLTGTYEVRGSHTIQANVESQTFTQSMRRSMRVVAVQPIQKIRHGTQVLSDRFKARTARLRDRRNARKGLAVVAVLVIVGVLVIASQDDWQTRDGIKHYSNHAAFVPEVPSHRLPNAAYNTAKPLLLINDHPRKGDPEVKQEVLNALNAQEDHRLNLARRNDDAEVALRRLAPGGQLSQLDIASDALNKLCKEHGINGLVLVEADPDGSQGGLRLLAIIPTGAIVGDSDKSTQLDDSSLVPLSNAP